MSGDGRTDFTALYRDLREPILALCRNIVGDAAEAEDALQETFLAVYHALPRFRGESKPSTWVYRIAIRTALRQASRFRRRSMEPLTADPPAAVSGDPAEARELSERLDAAMARLPVEHRTVLSLFSVEGLAHEEIATILGIPIGTVWSRLHTARKKLRKILAINPATIRK
jgi:RNA polymerase sigma-70 factor (ECF subfamily)